MCRRLPILGYGIYDLSIDGLAAQKELKVERNFVGIVGQSNAIKQVLHQIELVTLRMPVC
jgi:hypothetical protein